MVAPAGGLPRPPQKQLRQVLDWLWWRAEGRVATEGPAKKVRIGIFGLVFAARFCFPCE